MTKRGMNLARPLFEVEGTMKFKIQFTGESSRKGLSLFMRFLLEHEERTKFSFDSMEDVRSVANGIQTKLMAPFTTDKAS